MEGSDGKTCSRGRERFLLRTKCPLPSGQAGAARERHQNQAKREPQVWPALQAPSLSCLGRDEAGLCTRHARTARGPGPDHKAKGELFPMLRGLQVAPSQLSGSSEPARIQLPKAWADGKPLPFPRMAPAEVWAGELGRGLGASLQVPSPYLLFKAVWGQEEAVQRHEVALQEPHEQHQVHPICKLEGEGQLKALGPGAPRQDLSGRAHPSPCQRPEGYLPRQAAGRGEGRWPEAGRPALRQAHPTSGWPRTEPPPVGLVSAALACPEH